MRTSEEYTSDLEKMEENVWVGGEKTSRTNELFQPGINVINLTFEMAQEPEYEDIFTAKSHLREEKINRFTHIPQTQEDLMKKQKMIRLGAQRAGGCIQRCMGLDAIIALSFVTKDIDDEYDTEYYDRFTDYLEEYQKKDLAAACAQTDVKGDRSKRPHEQEDPDLYLRVVEENGDGIVVKGAKHEITMAAYADEIIVIPTRAMAEGDEDYAVSFAVPGDHENVRHIARPARYRKRKGEKAPIAEKGVAESVIIFDRTFIPRERVFMCKEREFARMLALGFANSHRHSYTGCKPAVSDILAGASALAAECNNIERASHVREKISEIIGNAELSYAAGIASAVEGTETPSGTYFPNPIYANVGRRLMGEEIYNEYSNLTEIAGGQMVTLPYEEDFINEETGEDLRKYMRRNPNISSEDQHKAFRFLEDIGASSMATWYQIAGVHGGGSPIMETITLMAEYDTEAKKNLAKYLAGINENLEQDTKFGADVTVSR
ncbi:aromatic ring hydroxylase [candidate division MSBL1 archaeon SCGC-AAA259E22]|uniref:Aromatic ring hydroxylase n=1 Tax=candidate division MSBL1 archaeon SCGC-AAA259E22 TaxID=1698265 RepID=A0A133UIP7_9EURY|nr:aromatic ring hydroxylase [candidate division MSBL1 archaeon SCGC-AAA259E22]